MSRRRIKHSQAFKLKVALKTRTVRSIRNFDSSAILVKGIENRRGHSRRREMMVMWRTGAIPSAVAVRLGPTIPIRLIRCARQICP